MLRISRVESPAETVTLRLEGQVRGPWVEELCQACEQLLARGSSLVLDLTDVSFIDLDGVALLDKAVLVLSDVEELSNRDIGEVLGLSVLAVKARLHRARLFLRGKLSVTLDIPPLHPFPPAASNRMHADSATMARMELEAPL
jgi:ABC-type transporter Mla MlaB component